VRTNADTPRTPSGPAASAREGIGLCRTEHMFLGDRRQLVEDLVLADGEQAQADALAALLPLQQEDFVGILRAMDGLPVTVRLLDPPLHEFLPDYVELQVEVAVAEATGQPVDAKRAALLDAVRRLHESNPMIGLRGVRLGLVIPGLFAVQVRALAQAAAQLKAEGLDPRPEVMVPLVSAVQELEIVREEALQVLADVAAETGQDVPTPIGR
jgi:pyruvate,orthophosphate dikinase